MGKAKKYSIIGIVILIIAALIYFLQGSRLLDVAYLEGLISGSGAWAPIVFVIIYILITVVGISAALFTVLAGTIFGTGTGLVLVVIAATIAATIAFYIARFFRHKFETKGKKKEDKHTVISNLIKRIEDNSEKNGFTTIAILRLAFLPYIPLSYAAGLVKNLKARDFILATLITNVFGSFVFIFLGDKLGDIIKGNTDVQTLLTLLGAIVLLVLFIVFVPKIAKRFEK